MRRQGSLTRWARYSPSQAFDQVYQDHSSRLDASMKRLVAPDGCQAPCSPSAAPSREPISLIKWQPWTALAQADPVIRAGCTGIEAEEKAGDVDRPGLENGSGVRARSP